MKPCWLLIDRSPIIFSDRGIGPTRVTGSAAYDTLTVNNAFGVCFVAYDNCFVKLIDAVANKQCDLVLIGFGTGSDLQVLLIDFKSNAISMKNIYSQRHLDQLIESKAALMGYRGDHMEAILTSINVNGVNQLIPDAKFLARFVVPTKISGNFALTNAYVQARVNLQIANIRLMRSTAPEMDWAEV